MAWKWFIAHQYFHDSFISIVKIAKNCLVGWKFCYIHKRLIYSLLPKIFAFVIFSWVKILYNKF